jgi:hypothetical protein
MTDADPRQGGLFYPYAHAAHRIATSYADGSGRRPCGEPEPS